MEKAYFKDIRREIIPLLDKAKESIHVAMAWFTSHELFESLLRALGRGIETNLILLDNAINWQPYAPDFNEFISKGGKLYIASSRVGFMHHKFCVIDQDLTITGSYNWTYYAETRNLENIVISSEKSTVDAYLNEFHRLRSCITLSEQAPKYTWEELAYLDDVDYHELNYEVKTISDVRNLPVRTVIETSRPVVQVMEIKKKVIARNDIGVIYYENGINKLMPLIPAKTGLPTDNRSFTFYNIGDEEVWIEISKREPNGKITQINLSLISQLIEPKRQANLPIVVTFALNENGYLNVDILCKETGLRKNIQLIAQDLIAYED